MNETEAAKNPGVKLPNGMLADLHIYLASEFQGEEIEVVVSLRGFRGIPSIDAEIDLPRLAQTLNLDIGPLDIEKTRLMTPSEIAEYRRKESEGD